MHTLKTTTIVSAALISLLLSACGGDGSGVANNQGGGGGSDPTTSQKIGLLAGGDFQAGKIGVTNGITTLFAGGATTLEVYIVNSNNNPVTASTTVNFISECISANKAVLTNNAGTATSSTTTINGRATMNYTANGCVGPDRVTATATINDTTASAVVDLTIEQGTVGSIEFTSATPDSISLKGSGGIETSVVRFRVVDSSGAPIGNTSVSFTMSTAAGGLSLSPSAPDTALSDSDGYVNATISSGTVPTDVSVTATVVGSSISTTSRILKIATGVPVQRSASLSATQFNPRAWDRDGTEVEFTMRMADDFGNPVVDGTAVTFWTEGGAIGPNCTTVDGACTVKWRSQASRPDDGRVTVLAFTAGNESFGDANTNGQYDANETFTDLDEAFLDANEDGIYNIGMELFVDLAAPANQNKTNGAFDAGNGVYNGTQCKSDDIAICSKEKITVRKSLVLAMSSPYGLFNLFSDPMCLTPSNGVINGNSGTVYILVSDVNGNSLPSGTEISGDGIDGEVVVPNTPNAFCYGVNVSGTVGNSSTIQVKAETEEEEVSGRTFTISFQ